MPLLFGIPTLDELIEIPGSDEDSGETLPNSDTTSLSVLGPDGSGKSVLALHLVSSYRAWCCRQVKTGPLPKILYISSDLQFESARKVWGSFKLNQPGNRHVPFERIESEIARRELSHDISLIALKPGAELLDEQSVAKFLLKKEEVPSETSTIGFLDLAHHTAGDDWNFVNSLIVNIQSCPRPTYTDNKGRKQVLSHLVIIDSVAGFETLMGTYDAYGMEQSRRARIAQSMRNADEHAHLVFVVEEPDEGKRLPEEYVTDVVVRLRSRRNGDRPTRTVEVEKARARNHATGEHTFEIRNRKGSSTGNWENPDAPATSNNYVHVFRSLSHCNLRVGSKVGRGRGEGKQTVAAFGLRSLDRLLERVDPTGQKPSWGIRAGTTATIIGNTGTGKSALGETFLACGFKEMAENVLNMWFVVSNPATVENRAEIIRGICKQLSQAVVGETPPPPETSICPFELQDIWKVLEAAWRCGEAHSARNLEAMENLNPATKDFERGSVQKRWEVLQARRVPFPENAPLLRSPDTQKSRNTEIITARSRSNYYANFEALQNASQKALKELSVESHAESIKSLFRHPNLRWPAVLLTTSDRTATMLAQRCVGYLVETIDKCMSTFTADDEAKQAALKVLLDIIEEQLIVRRFDIDNITSAALFDTIHRNVVEAQYLIHGPYFPPDQAVRYERAERIRVVIDDMRVLSNLCPAVSEDPAFLPFLVFDLEREGVTTLIVHTDDLRPGQQPNNPISQELTSLLKRLILTWSVPFEGQSRIAISAIPASSKETNGIIREVDLRELEEKPTYFQKDISADLPRIDVTRHLELYADLESGKPRLVPLAIYLYSSTPAWKKYMDLEDVLYHDQFLPVPGLTRNGQSKRVLWPIDATEYFAIRDITHLPWDVKADHTIVDQVDSFWSLDYERGALASQREYLTEKNRAEHEDSFGLFRGQPLSSDGKESPPFARQRYFRNSNYESRIFNFGRSERKPDKTSSGMPDRIPFTWDFGFIVVPADPWDRADRETITYSHSDPSQYQEEKQTVGNIRKMLSEPWEEREIVKWRTFLGACKVVGELARKERGISPVAFDFAATSAETLLSLILEIWFSEITEITKENSPVDAAFCKRWNEHWLPQITAKEYVPISREAQKNKTQNADGYSLAELLLGSLGDGPSPIRESFRIFREHYQSNAHLAFPNARKNQNPLDAGSIAEAVRQYESSNDPEHIEGRKLLFGKLPTAALCLYKTWLLLQDVFDFAAILDPSSSFEIKQPKAPSKSAMAVRHYYRTACHEQSLETEGTPAQPQYALAMPGNFSVRGDSFLASAKASRSQLLASNAIDLLCSRRANLTRMQMGIGLPVRDVLRDDQCKQMRTALRTIHEGSFDELKYDELCKLGGTPPDAPKAIPEKTRWLFRNGIPDYDRTSRAMQKWLTRLSKWTIAYRASNVVGWDGGFSGYDALSVFKFAPFVTYNSFEKFAELCDYLVADLVAAERKRP